MERLVIAVLLATLAGCAGKPEPQQEVDTRSFVPAPVPKCNHSPAAALERGVEASGVISGALLSGFAIAAAATGRGAAYGDYSGSSEIRGLRRPSCTGLCC